MREPYFDGFELNTLLEIFGLVLLESFRVSVFVAASYWHESWGDVRTLT